MNALNQNGFIVYFSDRRNNKCNRQVRSCPRPIPVETGEYGFEDVVNPAASADRHGLPNLSGVLDVGEDVNALHAAPGGRRPSMSPCSTIYGKFPPTASGYDRGRRDYRSCRPSDADSDRAAVDDDEYQWVGMVNRPVFFRRALKLVNGGNRRDASNLPSPGLTVASENPVYVQGNYNARSGPCLGVSRPRRTMAAAILADSVTPAVEQLERQPIVPVAERRALGRAATTTGYRFAVVSGKSLSFPYPAAGTPQFLFGTDGGVGNFLRLLEDWRHGTADIHYRGSIVSLFISRQATGTYKYCSASTTTAPATTSSTRTFCCRRCCRRARRCSATSTR